MRATGPNGSHLDGDPATDSRGDGRGSLNDERLQSTKLEALGRLAGGVAHDFNNLLTVIEGYARMLRDEGLVDASARDYVDEILKAADRASTLTRQLLAFSRRQPALPRVVDLNEVVRSMHGMLRRVIGEDVELLTSLSRDSNLVLADPGHIEQVVMNLVVNARDAMPDGGRIRVETGHQGPGWIELRVADNGSGIPDDVRDRIFEPFFTTKEAGKGTGLGLSVVQSIVDQCGGRIEVETQLGVGTLFRIVLPEHQGQPERPAPDVDDTQAYRGKGTILLVEDETPLRTLMRRILTQRGYSVIECEDGEAAVDRIRNGQQRVDLLIADVMLPKRSGREVADELRKAQPRARILFISGYGEETPPQVPRLEKPFSPGTLAQTVSGIFEAKS